MLMKANGADEIDKALTTWRALTPHWNLEADRIRKHVQGGEASLVSESEVERLSETMRRTVAGAERLLLACPAGDGRFAELLRLIAECEALLGSFQRSLDRLDPAAQSVARMPVRRIVHREGHSL
jgi:hypothetical protein